MNEVVNLDTRSGDICRQYLSGMARLGHVPSVLILKLGRGWRAQALPVTIPRGPQRQCFQNAGLLSLERPELTYVEGYACPRGLIPINHAWCVDPEGRVIDNTLLTPETTDYHGVPISRASLQELVAEAGHWGLFAEHMTAALLDSCIADVQAGAWPAPAADADEVIELLRPHLHD